MKYTIALFVLCFSFSTMGQYVMLTGYPQKVPNGKKWTLPTKQEILIEVNSGTLTSFM